MNSTIDTGANDLPNTIASIIGIVIILLYFLLAMIYVILILTHKTFRSNKLNWPTVNVALTTAYFSLNHLVFIIIRFKELSIISCRLLGFLLDIAACEMMYAYCVSSFNRLLAIRYFNKLIFRSSRWLLTTMIIGWIIGVLFAIPHSLYNSFACLSDEPSMLLNAYTCITTLILPIHIVTVCNISIFRYIHRVSQRIHDSNNNKNNSSISRKRDAHVSKMMLLTFSLFVIGWTPIFFQQLFTTPARQLPIGVSIFFELLLPISLLGDMIVLLYANQPVRQLIKEKLHCNRRI
jgi:hypothetical protein